MKAEKEKKMIDQPKKKANKSSFRKVKSKTMKNTFIYNDLIDEESLESKVKEKEIESRGKYELRSDLTNLQSRQRKERLRQQILEKLAADQRKKKREESIMKKKKQSIKY